MALHNSTQLMPTYLGCIILFVLSVCWKKKRQGSSSIASVPHASRASEKHAQRDPHLRRGTKTRRGGHQWSVEKN